MTEARAKAIEALHNSNVLIKALTGQDDAVAGATITGNNESLAALSAEAAAVPADREGHTQAAIDVFAERRRQSTGEGFDADHDAWHVNGELAEAAACYAMAEGPGAILSIDGWPWDGSWWKPKDRRRNLVRAGALIIAEIERLDRQVKP